MKRRKQDLSKKPGIFRSWYDAAFSLTLIIGLALLIVLALSDAYACL